MFNKKIKQKWLKFIPSGSTLQINENIGGFLHGNHIKRNLLHLNKLWFYLNYQLNIYKNIAINNGKILLITDRKNLQFTIKTIAIKTNSFFVIGPWKGGSLTDIKDFKKLPSFIIIFGLHYLQNTYNEIQILGIPCINLIHNIGLKKYFTTNYFIPFSNTNTLLIRNLCCLFVYFFKKYIFNYNYLIFQIKKKINPIFADRLKMIFYKIEYYKKTHFAFKCISFKHFKIHLKYKNKLNLQFLLENSLFFLINSIFFWKIYNSNYIYKKKKLKNKRFCLQTNTQILTHTKKKKLNLNFIEPLLFKKNIINWFKIQEIKKNLIQNSEVIELFENNFKIYI